MAAILRFAFASKTDWTNLEQAEFVRAAALLRHSGLRIVCERGLSDEGDPWTIFLREDTGDVIAHIARIDGRIFATSTASGDVLAGPNLRDVMDKVVRTQPLILPPSSQGSQLHLHPATVLVAFIATAFVWSQRDDDSRHLDWRVHPDGTVAVDVRGAPHAGGILRDAVLSKTEIARLGLDTRSALSDSMALAAAVAALALVTAGYDTLHLDVGAPLAELQEDRRAPEVHAALAHNDGDRPPVDGETAPTVASNNVPSDDTSDAMQRPHTVEASHPSGASSTALVTTDAADVRLQAEQTPSAGHLTTTLTDEARAIPILLGPESARAKDASSAGPMPEELSALVHDDARAAVHGPSLIFSSDAGRELLAWVLGTKQSGHSSSPSDSTDVQLVTLSSTDIPVGDHGLSQSPASGAAPSGSVDGYQILTQILSFAADQAHVLSPPAPELHDFQQALTAQPFLPVADKVLIVDVPDLNADMFKFSDGLIMIARQAATKLLPDLAMAAQVELSLSNGSVLKLIGVIDLHPAPHTS